MSKNDFPIRAQEHIMEDRSKQMLDAAIPSHWISRTLDKVDYGIDSFLEIGHRIDPSDVSERVDALMKGEVVFVQLKAHLKPVPWRGDGTYAYPGIAWSTAMYWLSLEVPVFFVLADLDANTLYFANAKSQIRSKYADRLKYETLSIEVGSKDQLSRSTAEGEFYSAYKLEQDHRSFALRLVDLVLNQDKYYEYLLTGLSRDYHGVLDPEEEVTLFHLIRLVSEACAHLDLPPPPLKVDEWVKENLELDLEQCKDGSTYEVFRMRVCQWLLPWFFLCLPSAVEKVLKREAAFWQDRDSILHYASKWNDRLLRQDKRWWQYLHRNDPFHIMFETDPTVTVDRFLEATEARAKIKLGIGDPFW